MSPGSHPYERTQKVPTAIDISKAAQEQILTGVKQSHELALAGLDLWVKTVGALGAKAPVALPADAPAPQDLVANSFGFAEQLLAAQKDFAEKAAETTAPLFKGAK
jgi:hypothetical protein